MKNQNSFQSVISGLVLLGWGGGIGLSRPCGTFSKQASVRAPCDRTTSPRDFLFASLQLGQEKNRYKDLFYSWLGLKDTKITLFDVEEVENLLAEEEVSDETTTT